MAKATLIEQYYNGEISVDQYRKLTSEKINKMLGKKLKSSEDRVKQIASRHKINDQDPGK